VYRRRERTKTGDVFHIGAGGTTLKNRLAVAYDTDSSSPMEIVAALGELCDIVWVIDSSQPLGAMARLLPRLGTVVDRVGLAPAAAVAALGATAPDGIVAFTDSQLATASMLAAGLGLRFNNPGVTQLFLDKNDQRAALHKAGIAVPGFASIPADASAPEIIELTDGLAYPGVLKPRNGYGSRDTYHVNSADQLLALLAPARGGRVAAPVEYVLEEYLRDAHAVADEAFADYVSIESAVANGRPRHLAVTGKFPLDEPYRETGNFMPSGLPPEDEAAVLALADQIVAALGVEYGSLHTEIKLTPDGPRVIESNARVGGGGIENIFGMAYGHSLQRIFAMTVLGIELPAAIDRVSDAIAYQLFVQPPFAARRLVGIDGTDDVNALPGVEQISFNRQVGDEIDWRQGSQAYVVTIRGWAADRDTLRRTRAQILEQLVLRYD
jgi:biotin carboxylase